MLLSGYKLPMSSSTESYKHWQMLCKVPGDGLAFIEGIFGCGKTLVQAMLAKLLIGLAASMNSRNEAILGCVTASQWFVLSILFLLREWQSSTGCQPETGLRLDFSSCFQIRSGHVYDLQTHVDRFVATMSERGDILPFDHFPDHERVRQRSQLRCDHCLRLFSGPVRWRRL